MFSTQKKHITPQAQGIINFSSRATGNINRLHVCLIYSAAVANLAIIIALITLEPDEKHLTLKNTTLTMKYISENLNTDPIIDILPGDSSSQCTSGYSQTMLKLWSKDEIRCSRDIKYLGRIEPVCGENGKNCYKDRSMKPIPMYDWSDSFWCVKRLNLGTDYVKIMACPPTYRECSRGICVKDSLNCPLTSVTLTSSSVSADSKQYGSSHYLTLYRASGEAPLINIDITDNGMPCFSPDKIAKASYRPCSRRSSRANGCGRYGFDTLYSFWIDQRTEFAVLNDNKFPQYIFHLSEYLKVIKSTTSYLSGRRRITVNDKNFCQSMDDQIVGDLVKTAKKLDTVLAVTVLTAIVIHGFLVFKLFGRAVFLILDRSCKSFMSKNPPGKLEKIYWTLIFIEILLYIIMVALGSVFGAEISSYKYYFRRFKEENCFTEGQLPLVIDDVETIIEKIPVRFVGLSIALLVITSVSSVFIICLRRFKNRSERE